jgi:hypothetical protein
MQETLLQGLKAHRRKIHSRWEVLLRTERVNTPLAYPDSLVHLIDWTLDQVFDALQTAATRKRSDRVHIHAAARPDCPCGRNPLLAFFLAGEQALLEALVLEQASRLSIDPTDRDTALAELYRAVRSIARREIESFCSVCQYRATDHCRTTANFDPPKIAATVAAPCAPS